MNDQVLEVVSSGVVSSSQYQVAQSAKIMEMLSSALYSNKIKAVIRELSTNALDAHIMSGNMDKMPDVHLPTYNNLNFKIRDYGTGLSNEDMNNVYKVYGISNKSHSNDYNGCMGIGSKSPFAYTNSFTAISYYNGVKSIYINSKNTAGIPELNLMHTEPTTEPNGLEVSFAVKYSDVWYFEHEYSEVMKWFSTKFNVYKDGQKYDIDTNIQYTFTSEAFNLVDTATAVMGNVAYPICSSYFDNKTTTNDPVSWYTHGKQNIYVNMLNAGVLLKFELGEIDFDISREKLQYTDKTINAIKGKIDQIADKVETTLKDELSKLNSHWKMRQQISKWKNTKLKSLVETIDFFGLKVGKSNSVPDIRVIDEYNCGRRRGRCPELINATKATSIYLIDVSNKINSAKELVHNDRTKTVVLVPMKHKKAFADEQGLKDDDFALISSLPDALKNTSSYGTYVKTGDVFRFKYEKVYHSHNVRSYKDSWQEVTDESTIDDEPVYVPMFRYEADGYSPQSFASKLNSLKDIGMEIPTIYGIKRNGDVTGFDKFFDVAKEYIKGELDKTQTYELYNISNMRIWSLLVSRKSDIKDQGTLDFLNLIENKNDNLILAARNFGCPVEQKDMGEIEKTVLDKFPLLRILKLYVYDSEVDPIISYLNAGAN